jgi:hypothetical protein
MKTIKQFFTFLTVSIVLSITIFGQNYNKPSKPNNKIGNSVYRIPLNTVEGKIIWIVDGLAIRREIYPEFLYGGNEQRYPFIPKNEIWIDHAISADEYKYTLAHEIHERNLMARKGMSYADAHDSSLALELQMRKKDFLESQNHEHLLRAVSPTDCDNVKEIPSLQDSIRLKNIYRIPIGKREGIDIWIVDGSAVRREIFPDFGLSGNDLAYKFIPPKEIWIDAQISCEETEFSITSELKERELMEKGAGYDSAYLDALKIVSEKRIAAYNHAKKHLRIKLPKILERDMGTGNKKANQ